MSNTETLAAIRALLNDARRLLFITGAGMSAESGLPTYRGIGGLYNEPTEEGVPIEVALSGSTMAKQPALCWKYLLQIEQGCRDAGFNRGHSVIAEAEARFDVTVLTQNIDRFHQDAGSSNVIDIHGDVHDLYCTRCDWAEEVSNYAALSIPPACPECQALVRPDVTLFGEMLNETKLARLQSTLDDGFDMVFSIGTTSVFPYIAWPMQLAKQLGRPAVEINPGETEVSALADFRLQMGATEALAALFE